MARQNADPILTALQAFAREVKDKLDSLTTGEPEEQLRGPLERCFERVGSALGRRVRAIGETHVARVGIPDFGVDADDLHVGHIEVKAPGTGADPTSFRRKHDKQQWLRFQNFPNLIYTDGNEWSLFRHDTLVDSFRLSGDICRQGDRAVATDDGEAFGRLIRQFFAWNPAPLPPNPTGADVASLLAPLCRALRDEVEEAIGHEDSSLNAVASDWRDLLFPEAEDRQFADAYAQTVTFALLLAHAEGASTLTLDEPTRALAADHALLSRALAALTVAGAQEEIRPALRTLQRVIDGIPAEAMARGHETDPWLYFYEDFLAAYDPVLRKNTGVYYTPVEVVRAQVRLIDRLLVDRLGIPTGFVDPSVVTLDPAVGTGTYLLGVIEHALARVAAEEGPGAVPGRATDLAKHLHGFEIMVGPYAVAQLRVSRALAEQGAALPEEGPGVRLTDTLESPYTEPQRVMAWYQLLSQEHERALRVKRQVPVLVCLGNPPYDRHEAAGDANRARTGGWVRWGDSGDGNGAILRDFTQPASEAGHGVHLKWLYNQYVYFWRWALWKVFEHDSSTGAGIASFITASSYLFGDAFVGMREHLRRVCDEMWIIDLGGEGRGTRQEENVFDIRTPVAIAICVRYEQRSNRDVPACARYARIDDNRAQKLSRLNAISDFSDIAWEDCPTDWHAPFLPRGAGGYFDWPRLRDVFPWQHSGAQYFRTWPIAPDESTLRRRWSALLHSPARGVAFRESRDRKVNKDYKPLPPASERDPPIARLSGGSPCPTIARYSYRSFDRQFAIADSRVGDVLKPVLWRTLNHPESRQLFLVSQLWQVMGAGPALFACPHIPDFHGFKGSYGGKDVIPLYRDAAGERPNIAPGLLELLSGTYGRAVTPEDFAAHVYAVLAHPGFTERFWAQLESRDLRVPLTKDAGLFAEAVEIGTRLLWLHTFGERFTGRGRRRGQVPRGRARCVRPVPDDPTHYPESFEWTEGPEGDGTLIVGQGAFAPVTRDVYQFEVSGLKVVQSWLNYRMKHPRHARKSSPLDDIRPERWTAEFTTELLRVLWILEATLTIYPAQASLLERIVEGDVHVQ